MLPGAGRPNPMAGLRIDDAAAESYSPWTPETYQADKFSQLIRPDGCIRNSKQ